MELTGQRIINASRETVWAAINNPEILAKCIPGCEELTASSDTEYKARVNLKIGPVRAAFSGSLVMADINAPSSCTLLFEGSGGAAGFTKGESLVKLTALSDTQTQLDYTAQASVGGKLGQIGGRLINTSAKKLADEFFTALEHQLDPTSNRLDATVIHHSDSGSNTNQHSAPKADQQDIGRPTKQAVAPPSASHPTYTGELVRVLWFALGVGTTLLGAFVFG